MTYRRFISGAYTTYKKTVDTAFGQYLFYTNVLLSMGISSLGDLLEQRYEIYYKEIEEIDLHRTSQMALSGFTTGIITHNWYKIIDRVITGRTFDMVLKKICLDQFICSPIVILAFFGTVAIFEENPVENFTDEVKDKFWTLYKAEWVVWPPAQLINFYFLPTRFRVIYDNTISLGYDIYTSHVKHDKSRKKETD